MKDQITQGKWKAYKDSKTSDKGFIEVAKKGFINEAEWIAENVKNENAEAICKAVNNTYGKGIDPEGLEDVQKLLRYILIKVNARMTKQEKLEQIERLAHKALEQIKLK